MCVRVRACVCVPVRALVGCNNNILKMHGTCVTILILLICRYGSITQASTVRLGTGVNGQDVYIPMSQFLPMVDPDDIVVDGWDISVMNLADAMKRAQVLDVNLQHQLYPFMKNMTPRPSIYFPDFIAANQVHSFSRI